MKKYSYINDRGARLRRYSLFTIRYSLTRGMTLVELLVAVSILVTLVAISVPMFKPMLEAQKTAGGARVVAMALERARVKAMESGQPCGVSFERYTEGGEDDVALRLRLVKMPKPYTGGDGATVTVSSGNITTHPAGINWGNVGVKANDSIQFNFQGKYHTLSSSGSTWTVSGVPDITVGMPYKIIRATQDVSNLRSILAPAVAMPRGTVVDLKYSGFDDATTGTGQTQFGVNHAQPVGIMFMPNGTVDRVHYGSGSGSNDAKMIYFCVGEWERGISVGHEDGKNNIQVGTSFWVTVNAKNGEVRTVEMNPTGSVGTARKFAEEHYVNLGGN